MAYCFISDLHLQEEKPEVTEAFLSFLDTTAKQAERLYILGDLFEVWIGDDLKSDLSLLIKEKLLFLKDVSTLVFAMHGNRDFLIGEKFCEDTGVTLLEDPCKLELFGRNALLMHGDLLCTKDVEYQKFRNTSRNPQWKKEFLDKPIEEREKLTEELRSKSKKATSQKKDEIMDVSPEAVKEIADRELPGFGEVMRMESMKITKNAILSRNMAAAVGNALVICLPGKPKGAVECLGFVEGAIPHLSLIHI